MSGGGFGGGEKGKDVPGDCREVTLHPATAHLYQEDYVGLLDRVCDLCVCVGGRGDVCKRHTCNMYIHKRTNS